MDNPHTPPGSTPANPYAPPVALIREQASLGPDFSHFIPYGRRVPAGNGTSWLGQSWALFTGAPFTWIGMWLLFVLLMMVLAFIPFANYLAPPLLLGGIALGCERWRRYRVVEIGDLFAGFQRHASPLLIQGLLYLAGVFIITIPAVIIMFVGIFLGAASAGHSAGGEAALTMVLLVALGVLLILALMLPLMAAMWFAPALIVLHDIAPFEAMKQSFFACFKNWLSMTVYSLVLLLLFCVAMIPCGLGLLVVGPWMTVSVYASYRDIFFES